MVRSSSLARLKAAMTTATGQPGVCVMGEVAELDRGGRIEKPLLGRTVSR
jgi:hypothetical protein